MSKFLLIDTDAGCLKLTAKGQVYIEIDPHAETTWPLTLSTFEGDPETLTNAKQKDCKKVLINSDRLTIFTRKHKR